MKENFVLWIYVQDSDGRTKTYKIGGEHFKGPASKKEYPPKSYADGKKVTVKVWRGR